MLADPQVAARDMVVEVDHPKAGKTKALGMPVKFSDTPAEVTRAAPLLGQHTDEILASLGYSPGDIDALCASGAVARPALRRPCRAPGTARWPFAPAAAMPSLLVVAALAVRPLVTSFISGILGMAGGMILMGVLLALLTVPQAMVLHGVTQLAANGWRAILWRREIDWRVFRRSAYGALVALAAFTLVQLVVSKPVAFLVLGITPFVGAGAAREARPRRATSAGTPSRAASSAPALQLLAGVSGPILDIFFVRSKMDRRAVVATKASIQSLSHVMKITYFGVLVGAAQRGTVDFWLGVLMVALAITGTTLSRRVLEKLTDASFRKWTRWTVLTMAAIYLVTGAWMLAR